MGNNIHIFAEKFIEDSHGNGIWKTADKWEFCNEENRYKVHDPIYSGENNALFSILCGFKNNMGLEIISPAWGLPDNLSPEVQDACNECINKLKPSWLSLEELMRFNWRQKKKLRVIVDIENYKLIRSGKYPETFYDSKHPPKGENILIVFEYEMKQIANGFLPEIKKDKKIFTAIEWEPSYWMLTEKFHVETIPKLVDIASEGVGLQNVRIVFFFDRR